MNLVILKFVHKLDSDLLKIDDLSKSCCFIIASCFSKHRGQIVVEHLESFRIFTADAATLFDSICQVFEKHSLPWKNVLLDSCNTIRGKKSGLEFHMRLNAIPSGSLVFHH